MPGQNLALNKGFCCGILVLEAVYAAFLTIWSKFVKGKLRVIEGRKAVRPALCNGWIGRLPKLQLISPRRNLPGFFL